MAYRKRHKKPSLRFLLIAALLLVLTAAVGVMAKYVTGFNSAYKQADAAEFYFLTDLDENTAENRYPVYDGIIRFTVKNHDALNTAERDIAYTVYVDNVKYESTYYLLGREMHEKLFEIAAADGNHTITLTSNSPYAKTITLYFKVNTHYADSFYTVTPHSGWCELELYTGASGDNVTVSYPNLQPDNTLTLTSSWSANGSGTLTGLEPYSHYHLIFFGTGSTFTLTQNGKTLSIQ